MSSDSVPLGTSDPGPTNRSRARDNYREGRQLLHPLQGCYVPLDQLAVELPYRTVNAKNSPLDGAEVHAASREELALLLGNRSRSAIKRWISDGVLPACVLTSKEERTTTEGKLTRVRIGVWHMEEVEIILRHLSPVMSHFVYIRKDYAEIDALRAEIAEWRAAHQLPN